MKVILYSSGLVLAGLTALTDGMLLVLPDHLAQTTSEAEGSAAALSLSSNHAHSYLEALANSLTHSQPGNAAAMQGGNAVAM